jgi:NAD(P)H dehydrogenase (quinone)
MKVLTIYAHPSHKSFCQAVLDRFTSGLSDAGHTSDVIDLYAIGFDPVLRDRDGPSWIDENVPQDILDRANLKEEMIAGAGGPIRRFLVRRWIGDKGPRAIIKALRDERIPKDVLEQQRRVLAADALVFIAPVWFVGYPAILKGWFERVFTLGFAFGLSDAGWHGDVRGRIPLLKHQKALIINTTIFNEETYRAGFGDAMTRLMGDWGLRYPGIRTVEHVFFYAVNGASDEVRRGYLDRAYTLGRYFDRSSVAAA